MTKTEFMNKLDANLRGINVDDKKDILNDFEEHFRVGIEDGKTEDEISSELGEPFEIAKQYISENAADKTAPVGRNNNGNIVGAVLIGILLFFFNVIFVLGLYCGAVGIILGLFGCAIGCALGGAAGFIAFLIPALRVYMSTPFNPAVGIFFSVGLAAVGILLFIGCCYITKYFIKISIKYFKWNINVIRRQGGNGDV